MLGWFKPQRLFKAGNVFKWMQNANQRWMPTVFGLHYKENIRTMGTATTDYFKRVIKEHQPTSKNDFDMRKHIQDFEIFEEQHAKRREAIRQKDKHQAKFGLRDYELEDYRAEGATGEHLDYKSLVQGKIPEDMIEKDRLALQIVDKLIPNMEVAVFNLTYDTTEEEIRTIFTKFGQIEKVKICKNILNDPSHAIITYKSHSSIENILSDRNEIWIRSNLLRIKTRSDASSEALENRTLVIGNIPPYSSKNDVLEFLVKFGSAIKIDMPMSDQRIDKIIDNLPNLRNERKLQHTYEERIKATERFFGMIDTRYATGDGGAIYPEFTTLESAKSTLAERIVNYEKEIQKRVSSKSSVYVEKTLSLIRDGSENLKLINDDKCMKVLTLWTMIYRESKMVNDSIKDIKVEHENLINSMNNSLEYQEYPSGTKTKSYITPHQIESLRKYVTYLHKNHESLPPELLSEINTNLVLKVALDQKVEHLKNGLSIADLNERDLVDGIGNQVAYSHINMQEELAKGYQWLLEALERREKILTYRLNRVLKDYGKKDRIIFERKDFKNELEDINYDYGIAGDDVLKVEDVISISEQMDNVIKFKGTDSDQSHLYRNDNPIDYDNPNFNKLDIESSKITEKTVNYIALRSIKRGEQVDQTYYKNSGMLPKNYRMDVMKEIIQRVHIQRDETDIPFDEMYHNEKALIENVARAERELQDAIKQNEKDLEQHTNSIEDVYENNIVDLFEGEDTRKLIKNLKFKNESGAEDSADALFSVDKGTSKSYTYSIEKWLQILENNYSSKVKKYFENYLQMKNRGYCFVTFSHADEAKKALLLSADLYMGSNKIDIFLKNELDHHDFTLGSNPDYFRARTLADAKILGKREQLVEAKRKLAEYEEHFEEKMPKTVKLNRMKDAAKEALEENYYLDRYSFPRSKQEDENVIRRAKALEESTGTDFSPLYQNKDTEAENIKRHRKAFDTYKSYSFLKAGLKKTPLEEKLTGKETKSPTEFNFPSPDDITEVYVNKNYETTLMDLGEENTNPGRKFKFNKRMFIESYYGKDFQRGQYVNLSDRSIYSFNDELKKVYSMEKLTTLVDHKNFQKQMEENAQKSTSEKLENPEFVDMLGSSFKKIEAEEGNTHIPNTVGKHPFLKGEFQDRVKKYIKDYHTFDENMKQKLNASQLKTSLKVERMEIPKDKIEKVIDKLNNPDRPRGSPPQAKRKSKKKKDDDFEEKWKPIEENEENEEDIQRHKEAVYSEYIDSSSADALKQGHDIKYSNIRKDFANKLIDKLSKQPKEPVKNDSDFLRLNNDQQNYLSELQKKRSYIQGRKDRNDYYNRTNKSEIENDEDKNIAHFNTPPKRDESVKNVLSKYKTDIRKSNEEFLYKHEYSKEHPENEFKMKADETVDFKKLKASSKTDKAFRYNIQQTQDNLKYSDKESEKDFLKRLGEASISEGLDARDEKLQSNNIEKNLSQIAFGAGRDTESIYKEYSKEKEQIEENEQESIKIREKRFLEEIKKSEKEDSIKENRTFQEYELYKQNKLKNKSESDESINKEEIKENDLSKRDWLAKIWTGKITPQEFEKYMMYTNYSQDKRGRQQINYESKQSPGRAGERFITKQDEERIYYEMIEKLRRDVVFNGIVSEEKSQEYIGKFVEKLKEYSRVGNIESFSLVKDKLQEELEVITHGEQVREYYFDPNQGVSLDDHIKAIKTHSGVKVETFVDKDGFTVIRKIIKKEYKYNLDDIMEKSPDELVENIESKVFGLIKNNEKNKDLGK